MSSTIFSNVITVLHEPQREVNIGSTVRALLNTGFQRLRLVQPVTYSIERLDDMAHRSSALVNQIETYASLSDALANVSYVVGFSGRSRGERQAVNLPEFAPTLAALAATVPVALVFGREDRGLDNAVIEQCSQLISIPVDPSYPSLNLADAVLLALYTIRGLATSAEPLPSPDLADQASHDLLLNLLDQLLTKLKFSRTAGQQASAVRVIRDLLARSRPSPSEIALVTAICRKMLAALPTH